MRAESHLKVDRDLLLAAGSYGITLVRLLIAGFGALTIWRGEFTLAVSSVILVIVLDYFDGATFEKSCFSTFKEWRIKRRIADSVSDRIVIQVICIPLLIKSPSFLYFFLLILGRELSISGYVAHEFSKGLLLYPRNVAKLACAMIGITVISFMTLPLGFTLLVAVTMLILSTCALFNYWRRVHESVVSTPLQTYTDKTIQEIT